MPLFIGVPYQPYSFLIKKLDDLIIAQDDKGRVRFSGTDASKIIQSCINALTNGGKIFIKRGFYEITKDIAYALNSISGPALIIEGEGGEIYDDNPKETIGGTVLYFNGADFLDGRFANWPEGYTYLILRNIALCFEGDGAGKGIWDGALTLPHFDNVALGIYGSYPNNAEVLFGRASGPYGRTAIFNNVHYLPRWKNGDYVIGMRLHFDTFLWLGGSISTNFGDVTAPRIAYLDGVANYGIHDISVFRGDTIPLEWFLVAITEYDKAKITFNGFTFTGERWKYFTNTTANPITILLQDVWFEKPVALGGTPPPTLVPIQKSVVGYVTENSGTEIFSGDGTTTTFTIAHGLAGTPKTAIVTAGSSDAKGDFYVTYDATNIMVTYATAPPSGTDNVVLRWYAEMGG